MSELPADPLGRLTPELLDYSTPTFSLKDDLDRLVRVSRVGAPEAVVCYCSRIVEALAADAVGQLQQESSGNMFSDLELLEHLNRLEMAVCCWADAVRRLGNQMRHVLGFVGPVEAQLSIDFAERWLKWYFCRFSHGLCLPGLTRDGEPLGLGMDHGFEPLLRSVEQLECRANNETNCPPWSEVSASAAFLQTPILPAAAAEIVLDHGQRDEALRILEASLARFPKDLRLRQLMGLYWSRMENFERALEWLEPLYAHQQPDDETAGITAAVYKRKWLKNRSDTTFLEKSHRAYRQAWKDSKKKNTWLGINAATTALYLGQRKEAADQAQDVERLLRKRAATLPEELRDPRLAFNYWDQATLAEAQLLMGDWPLAQQTYKDVFARYPERIDNIKGTCEQRGEILKALGLPPAVD
jgi:tetratricopeptide (TPR) repeat protein